MSAEKLSENVSTYAYDEAFQASLEYFDGDDLAAKVFVDKYALRNNDQQLLEKTPKDMHVRIAQEFHRIEKQKFKNPLSFDEIFSYLDHFKKIVPQGSPMYGIGNPYQYITLSNCYVLDTPGDSYGSIHHTDEQLSQISKRRGGCGIDISNIRPEGTTIYNAARTSTGIIPFMERYSNSIREVGQNGRRGALLESISVHHPQVLDFAKVKKDLTKVTGANISVKLTDEFLNAVANNEDYEQRWPVDSEKPVISKKVSARKVWMEIIENAWACVSGDTKINVLDKKGNFLHLPINKFYEIFDKNEDFRILSLNLETKKTEVKRVQGCQEYPNTKAAYQIKVNGQELRVTEDHIFYVLNANGDIESKQIKDIKVGEKMALARSCALKESEPKDKIAIADYLDCLGNGYHIVGNIEETLKKEEVKQVLGKFSSGEYRSTYYIRENYITVKDFRKIVEFFPDNNLYIKLARKDIFLPLQIPLNEQMAELFGLWFAEGSANNNTSTLHVNTSEVSSYSELVESISDTFESSFKIESEGDYSKIIFNCAFLRHLFKRIIKPRGVKIVPGFLFNCSKKIVSSFLRGVFSGDGGVDSNTISLSQSNLKSLKDIRDLLLLLGIYSKTHKKESAGTKVIKGKLCKIKNNYRLYIYQGFNRLFEEKIGFLQKVKTKKITSDSESTNFSVPFEINYNLYKKQYHYYAREYIKLSSIARRPEVKKDGKTLDFLNGDLYFGKLESKIKVNLNLVYDLTVEDNHTFVLSNGIILSNSAEPGLLFFDTILRESPADCYAEYGYKTVCCNPCVTADTWIMTDNGPKQVNELKNKKFNAIVNGKKYSSSDKGFFYTGYKKVYKITTNRGFEVKCTANHPIKVVDFKSRYKTTYKWVKISKLKIGDMVSLNNHRGISWPGEGNFDKGWLIGSLIGDGCSYENSSKLEFWGKSKLYMRELAVKKIKSSVKHRADLGSGGNNSKAILELDKTSVGSTGLRQLAESLDITEEKDLTSKIEKTSSNFYRGFLQSWFDADGTILESRNNKGRAVRLASVKLHNLKIAQKMLARLGIISTIYENRREAGYMQLPDGKGAYKEYYCEAYHELHVSSDNIPIFHRLIGFSQPEKKRKLKKLLTHYKRKLNRERFIAKITNIVELGNEDVFDCEIPQIHEFDGNGLSLHNCSELPLSELDSCRLLLLNLYTYVKEPFTKKAKFDFEEFYHDAQIAQRLMDDMIDLEIECIDRIIAKVQRDPEPEDIKRNELNLWQKIKEACVNGRRTGTGITALGDAIAALGIKYGSKESLDLTERIYRTLKLGCYRSSVDMAKELGAFPVWDYELEKGNPFLNRIKDEDPELYADMKKYGRRNIALLTTAPAGSVSILTQTSSGIEPVFMMSYTRRKKINPSDENARTDFVDQNGDHWQEFTVYHPKLKTWMAINSSMDISKSPYYGCCAEDLDWTQRVELQSRAGRNIDHSISSTINLPEDVSVEKVAEIYEAAWRAGLKGITVYRKNCRTGVLVEKKENKRGNKIQKTIAPERPKTLNCDVHHIKVKGEEYFVVVGLMDNNEPYEIFAGKNGVIGKNVKSGTITKLKRGHYKVNLDDDNEIDSLGDYCSDEEEALTRMSSTALRHGADIHFIVHQLEKVKGDMHSFARSMSRALKKYIKDDTKVSGETCPGCGSENLVRQEGCKTCKNCAWTACM